MTYKNFGSGPARLAKDKPKIASPPKLRAPRSKKRLVLRTVADRADADDGIAVTPSFPSDYRT
jgi:hypothetical protein